MNREKHSGAVWSYPLWISFWRISTLPLSPSFFFVLKISCQSPNVWVFFIGFSRSALFYPALCSREQPLLPSGFELCWPIGGPWWQVGWREVTLQGVYFPGLLSVRLLWWLPGPARQPPSSFLSQMYSHPTFPNASVSGLLYTSKKIVVDPQRAFVYLSVFTILKIKAESS